jgi:ADP-heptose:LPS heptosyltransferase
MSKNKILFATGEGIGNVIQTIPVIRTLNEVLGFEIDLWHAFGSFPMPKAIHYVNKWISGGQINNLNFNDYCGLVSTIHTSNYVSNIPLKLLNNPTKLSMTRSEVDTYMDIARDLGAKDFIWHGECLYSNVSEQDRCDVIIHDGYNRKSPNKSWRVKSYPRYKAVAEVLEYDGFKVGSVGSKAEYVEKTIDLTGFDLLTTLGFIKKCKVFLSNDSGLYHCANALRIPNVVIFTYTSTDKNYDRRFHKYSTIIGRDDLECRWCQCEPRFKTCETRECRKIDFPIVVEAVRSLMT